MRKSSSGRSAYSAPSGPGGLLFPGAHQKCRAGKRWLTSDGGDTAPPALKNPAASLAPKVPERGRVSQPPQHRRFLGFSCSPSRRRRTSATDGDPAGCVPVPKAVPQAMAAAWAGPRRRRRQPCWPELTMQAVHGQIPSLTGLQRTVITTVSGAAAEATPYYTGKGAGGRAQQGLLKRQQDKCRRGRHLSSKSSASAAPCTVPVSLQREAARWLQRPGLPGVPCSWNTENAAFSLARMMAEALSKGSANQTPI